MRRPMWIGLFALFLATPPLAAQDDPAMVYTAYYKVAYADLEEWTRIYHEVSVPVLEAMQEEGLITGFGVWQHLHGGEYNWRFAIRAPGWSNYGTFWGAFLSRSEAADPAAFAATGAMLQAHRDEVWDITQVNIPDGAPPATYFYDSMFQVSFADLDAWNAMWNESVGPLLDAAMANGTLGGWVVENHNTGGRYNWKVLYLFEEWDTMDDFFDGMMSGLIKAGLWERMGSMIQAHDDIIWTSVPTPGN